MVVTCDDWRVLYMRTLLSTSHQVGPVVRWGRRPLPGPKEEAHAFERRHRAALSRRAGNADGRADPAVLDSGLALERAARARRGARLRALARREPDRLP